MITPLLPLFPVLILLSFLPRTHATIPKKGEHSYTTSAAEADHAVKNLGFFREGSAGPIYPTPQPPAVPLFRFYNSHLDRHFYTISIPERASLLAPGAGWLSEGAAGYCLPSSTSEGGLELFRLYNGAIFDRLYTTSFAEATAAQRIGYKAEGAACNLPPPLAGTVPFLMLYRKSLAG